MTSAQRCATCSNRRGRVLRVSDVVSTAAAALRRLPTHVLTTISCRTVLKRRSSNSLRRLTLPDVYVLSPYTFTFFSFSFVASSIINVCCVVCTICSWVDSLATFATSRFCKQKKKIFDCIANLVDPKYVSIYRRFSSSLS